MASSIVASDYVGQGMAFNPQGTKAFVAVQPNQLYVIDTATLTTMARITVGAGPNDVIMMAEGDVVAVGAGFAPGTWWVDARKNRLITHSVAPGDTSGATMGLAVIR